MPLASLLPLIEMYHTTAGNGHPLYPLETMLRIHVLQNGFAFCDQPSLRQFAQLSLTQDSNPRMTRRL